MVEPTSLNQTIVIEQYRSVDRRYELASVLVCCTYAEARRIGEPDWLDAWRATGSCLVTVTMIWPDMVNLTALLTTLHRICDNRSGSVMIHSGN
jgi:hypothetical protein